MGERARIAVIGAGWWATEVHIPALLANPDAELVALVDTNPAKLASAMQHYGVAKRLSQRASAAGQRAA